MAVPGSSISKLAGTREVPGPWVWIALCSGVQASVTGEATGFAEANTAKHQACNLAEPPLPEPYHGPGSHAASQGDPLLGCGQSRGTHKAA